MSMAQRSNPACGRQYRAAGARSGTRVGGRVRKHDRWRRRYRYSAHATEGCRRPGQARRARKALHLDRKSVVTGKRVSVRVDLGGRRIIKKQIKTRINKTKIIKD